jgi:NADPH2 dehydrogenase
MDQSKLFQSIAVGSNQLSARLAMAPMTRCRASDDHVQLPFVKKYYAQRAAVPGTMIITEATLITLQSGSQANVPGIWNDEQVQAWKEIVDEVHKQGSYIWLQLWALGRAADPELRQKEGTGQLVSSSPTPMADGEPIPRELAEEEIQQYIRDFATAAQRAIQEARFDGVEIHAANGYLPDQFLQDTCNRRTDRWGGSVANRARFPLEVTRAVVDAVGAKKTGIRLSPWSTFQGMKMDDPVPQFQYLIEELRNLNLAYLHLIESRVMGNTEGEGKESLNGLVDLWPKTSPVILAGGFNAERARKAIDEEFKDREIVIAIGRSWISSPDLVFRLKKGIEMTPYDRNTFYTPKLEEGYIDYPFSKEWEAVH